MLVDAELHTLRGCLEVNQEPVEGECYGRSMLVGILSRTSFHMMLV
jgi:hypothetical protein